LSDQGIVYFDHAATSWPKPPEAVTAIARFLTETGANPGRSGHRMSIEAARVVYAAREEVAALVGAPDPLRVTFCANVTEALNLALYGLLNPGDHVVTTSVEHNAVMRPLRDLERRGVLVTVAPCSPTGELDPEQVAASIRPSTRLVVMTHASNVVGTLLPVAEVGRMAREHSCLLLVDTAQTAGAVPLDLRQAQIDILAFTGHKSLYGPMGTGGLVLGERVDLDMLRPLVRGGTGSNSEREEQPDFLPDRYESGTPNAVGLAGLAAGLRWVRERGVDSIREHETALARRLIAGLTGIRGVNVYGTGDARRQTATVAFDITGMSPSEVGFRLDEEYGIMCRVGLHCAPAAHRTIGTFPTGAVRFGLGAMNTESEVERVLVAVAVLAREANPAVETRAASGEVEDCGR
jgi:cysteine desulfurase / selenocysteine lyase